MNGKDGWMDSMGRWIGWMDGRMEWNGMGRQMEAFSLQNEDSTGFFSSDRQSPRRIEDLRKEFLWNLQSSIQMQAGDCKFVSRYKEKSDS